MPDNAKDEILALLKAQDEATARGNAIFPADSHRGAQRC